MYHVLMTWLLLSYMIMAVVPIITVHALPHRLIATIPLLFDEGEREGEGEGVVVPFDVYIDVKLAPIIAHMIRSEVLSSTNFTKLEFFNALRLQLSQVSADLDVKNMENIISYNDKCITVNDHMVCDKLIDNILQEYSQGVDNFFFKMFRHTPPAFSTGYHPVLFSLVRRLYGTHSDSLNDVKNRIRDVYASGSIFPQYDDIEGELTTLFLLHYKPKNIVEFSPSHGWSTLYILNALNVTHHKRKELSSINDDNIVQLYSYDLEDFCSELVKRHFPMINNPNSSIKWTLKTGDVRKYFGVDFIDSFVAGQRIDYLFIDSDHSKEFVQYYLEHLLTPLLSLVREAGTSMLVSVHDCFTDGVVSHEGYLLHTFLTNHNISYLNLNNQVHQSEIKYIRKESNFSKDPIHFSNNNPSIYFILA